jgi:hypothetical protein
MMTRQNANAESREGLLHSDNTYALRSSLDQASRSSTDSIDRLDSLDLHAAEKSKCDQKHMCPWLPKRPPWSTGYTYEESQARALRRPARHKGIKELLVQRKTCCIVTVILAFGLITLMGSGALWVYNAAPLDGVSCLGPEDEPELTCATAIAIVVPNPSRRHGSSMARELQEGRGDGEEDEPG